MKQVPIYNSKCSILNIDQYSVKAMKVKATELQHLGYRFFLYKALFLNADVFNVTKWTSLKLRIIFNNCHMICPF